MRILTEENINQIENLTFSKNVDRLMQRPVGNLNDIMMDIRRAMFSEKEKKQKKMDAREMPDTVGSPPIKISGVADGSPEYNPATPSTSPPYNPATPSTSPPYIPLSNSNSAVGFDTENRNESPPYATGSPARFDERENPSPPYATGSPAFKGGLHLNMGGESVFQVNDVVSIRGGKAPSKWRIKEIGSKFLTLNNMNPLNDEDTIKIVEPHQIYHATHISPSLQMPTEYDMNSMGAMGAMQPMMQPMMHPSQDPMNGFYGATQQPGIQINPTFVIGDNNNVPGDKDGVKNDTGKSGTIPTGNNYEPVGNVGIKMKSQTGGDGGTNEVEKMPTEKSESSNSFFDFLKSGIVGKINKLG